MISGREIIEDIVNEVRRRLQADCYLAPHMAHPSFGLFGWLELSIASHYGPPVVTECFIRLSSANNGLDTGATYPDRQAVAERAGSGAFGLPAVEVSSPGYEERKAAEPLPATRVEVRSKARHPVPVLPPADEASVCQLERIIREQPGQSSNEIFRRAGMGRARTLRLLNAHAGVLWKAMLDGQTRKYSAFLRFFPLSTGTGTCLEEA